MYPPGLNSDDYKHIHGDHLADDDYDENETDPTEDYYSRRIGRGHDEP